MAGRNLDYLPVLPNDDGISAATVFFYHVSHSDPKRPFGLAGFGRDFESALLHGNSRLLLIWWNKAASIIRISPP
jgi:hypothetical protein